MLHESKFSPTRATSISVGFELVAGMNNRYEKRWIALPNAETKSAFIRQAHGTSLDGPTRTGFSRVDTGLT